MPKRMLHEPCRNDQCDVCAKFPGVNHRVLVPVDDDSVVDPRAQDVPEAAPEVRGE